MTKNIITAIEYLERNQYEDAESVVAAMILEEPNNRFALQIAAISSRKLGSADKAMELWQRSLITPLPDLPSDEELEIINRIGDLMVQFKQETYLKINPEALALANMGAELARIGNIQAAEELFTKAIETDPNCELAHFNRGVSAYNLRDFPLAIHCMQETLRINPANRKAQGALRKLRGQNIF